MAKNRRSEEQNYNIRELEGLPKSLDFGKKVKRISGDVKGGASVVQGDAELGKRFVEALSQRGAFNRATHKFHSYPARLHPEAARILVDVVGGKRLGDPFCGGGTILVEGLIAGKKVFGSDINQVAVMVSRARCALLGRSDLEELTDVFRHVYNLAKQYSEEGYKVWLPAEVMRIKRWYRRSMFDDFAYLYSALQATESRFIGLIEAVFSSLLVKYSLRASETSNRIIPRDRDKGEAILAFGLKSEEYLESLWSLRELVPEGSSPAEIFQCDARQPFFEKLDAIITSPPYPGTYDYSRLQQLRKAWFGWEEDNGDNEIGSRYLFSYYRRKGYNVWERSTQDWMRACGACLVSGGRLCVVIGEGVINGKRMKVEQPTCEAAKFAGMDFIASGSMERWDPATSDKKKELILLFEKK